MATDLFILKNQVLLNILKDAMKEILSILANPHDPQENLEKNRRYIVKNTFIFDKDDINIDSKNPTFIENCEHILDCMHRIITYNEQSQVVQNTHQSVPSANQLQLIGVKVCIYNRRILNIEFDETSSIIYLPRLLVCTNTEIFIKNFIVYKALAEKLLAFTSYMILMNHIMKKCRVLVCKI